MALVSAPNTTPSYKWGESVGLITLLHQWGESVGLITLLHQWGESVGLITLLHQWGESVGMINTSEGRVVRGRGVVCGPDYNYPP